MDTNENKEEIPVPVTQRGWSKTWRRADLDRPEKHESKAWIECIEKPIREAYAKQSEDELNSELCIEIEYGNEGRRPWIKRDEVDLIPDAANEIVKNGDPEGQARCAKLIAQRIWDWFDGDTKRDEYFRLRVFCLKEDTEEARADYRWFSP
jgi:hypothetical protein